MANHSYEYKGHWISIDVDCGAKGLCTWSYTIDGAQFTENRDRRMTSEGAMLLEAKHSAEGVVDRMPAPEP